MLKRKPEQIVTEYNIQTLPVSVQEINKASKANIQPQ